MQGTIYSKDTGEIYTSVFGPDKNTLLAQLPLYHNPDYVLDLFLEGDDWYLPNGVKTPRPDMKLQVSKTTLRIGETLTISGIPKGARVVAQGVDETVNDGVLEWTSAVPLENFRFEFIMFPYKYRDVDIEVTNV